MNFGLFLQQARKSCGLTAIELAARMGVPQPSLSRLEHLPGLPSGTTMLKIAGALDSKLEISLTSKDGQSKLSTLTLTVEKSSVVIKNTTKPNLGHNKQLKHTTVKALGTEQKCCPIKVWWGCQ